MGAEIDRLDIAVEAQASSANRQLDSLVAKLNSVSSSLSRINASGLTGFANGIQRLSNSMKSMNEIKTTDFSRLVRNVGKMSSLDTAKLNATASSMSHMTRTLNAMGSVSQNAIQIGELANNISKLGNKSVQSAISNMPKLATSLNNLMATLSNAPKVSGNLIQMVSALANLSTHVPNINSAANSMSNLGAYASKSDAIFKRLSNTISTFTSRLYRAKTNTGDLAQKIGKFYASFFMFIRGVKAVGKSIESSMDYIETFNYYNVTMDKIASEFKNQWKKYGYDSAESYAESFNARLNDLTEKMSGYKVGDDGVLSIASGMNLGLDPNKIMNYQASIAAVTNSVGLCGEASVNTSKALTMLAADLSSFKNVDLSTVMTNMQSGLIGQSRALYKYGIDITNATLQTYAYKYGLSTAVSEMTQADKMQLRLLAILDQSRVAWGDQANTINSVANQYRILKQQIQNVARAIGNILMPVVQAILPVVNGILIAVQRMLSFFGALFGIDFSAIMDGISSGYSGSGLEDIADSADSAAGSLRDANDSAKKLQSTLLGFDQINKLSDNTDASGGGGGISGGAGGIDLSDEIAAALADYEAVWNKAFENSVNKAQEYADKICSVFNKMWSMIKSRDYEGLGEYIAGGVDFVFEKVNSVFNWDKMGPGITSFVDGYTRTLNSLIDNIKWDDIGKTIGVGANVVINTLYLHLTGIDWAEIGTAFSDGVNGALDSIDWDKVGRTIGAWIMKIQDSLCGFASNLDWNGVGDSIGSAINGALEEIDGETFAKGVNSIINGILDALKSIITTADWSKVVKSVGDVLGNLDWGTFAGIGLVLGSVKLASAFRELLSIAFSEYLVDAFKVGLNSALPDIGALLGSAKIGEIISLTIGGAGTLSESIAAVLGSSIQAIASVVGGIAVIIAGIIDLWKTSETFRDNVKEMLSIIGDAFSYAKKRIWDESLALLWDDIKEFFGSLYGLYEQSGLKDIFELVVTAIGYITATLLSGLINTISDFVWFLSGCVRIVLGVFQIAIAGVQDFFREHKAVFDGLKRTFNGLTDFISGIFTWNWALSLSGIRDIFSGTFNALIGIARWPINSVLGMLEGMANSAVSVFNTIKRAMNSLNVTIPEWIPGVGGKKFGFNFGMTSYVSLPRFENGGFPNIGEMFIARENGIPEMVGRVGTRAAVANNDQIVSGISSGVRNAVIDAVAEVAIAMNGSHGREPSAPVIELTIKCDSETLYHTTQKGKQKADRRYQVVVPVI